MGTPVGGGRTSPFVEDDVGFCLCEPPVVGGNVVVVDDGTTVAVAGPSFTDFGNGWSRVWRGLPNVHASGELTEYHALFDMYTLCYCFLDEVLLIFVCVKTQR